MNDENCRVSEIDWIESSYVVSPGTIIRNIILSYNDTPIETYIKGTNLTKEDVYNIIDDKVDIDAPLANEIQAAFGVNADVMLTIARNYRIYMSSKEMSEQKLRRD